MQKMHKSTHDKPLTGAHLPIHRAGAGVAGPKVTVSTSTGGTYRGAWWRTEAIITKSVFKVYLFIFIHRYGVLGQWPENRAHEIEKNKSKQKMSEMDIVEPVVVEEVKLEEKPVENVSTVITGKFYSFSFIFKRVISPFLHYRFYSYYKLYNKRSRNKSTKINSKSY